MQNILFYLLLYLLAIPVYAGASQQAGFELAINKSQSARDFSEKCGVTATIKLLDASLSEMCEEVIVEITSLCEEPIVQEAMAEKVKVVSCILGKSAEPKFLLKGGRFLIETRPNFVKVGARAKAFLEFNL